MQTFMLVVVILTFICVTIATAMDINIDKPVIKKQPEKQTSNIRKEKRRRK